MRFKATTCALITALALPAAAGAQSFVKYPGSTLDQAASDAATKAGGGAMRVGVYITGDPLERVVAFYKPRYKATDCGNAPALPNGQRVKWACFVLDGAEHLWTSKSWMKIQRPYISEATLERGGAQFKGVRETTVIETVEKK